MTLKDNTGNIHQQNQNNRALEKNMRNKKLIMSLLKKGLSNLLILIVILALVITVTAIPMDFGVSYYNGETMISITKEQVFESIKANFRGFASGELFKTMIKSESVGQILVLALKRSLILLIFGTLLAVLIGLVKGMIDSRRNGHMGTFKLLQSLIPLSIPDILVITLIQLGAMALYKNETAIPFIGVLPYFGDEGVKSVLLPILSISLLPGAYLARVVAGAIEEGLTKPYVLTARGKGCSMRQIITTHLSKPIGFSVLSALPAAMGILFSSLVIVEMFYSYRGIGYHLIYFYTTTLVPRELASMAFSAFIIALAVFYYVVFSVINLLKAYVMPKIKSE